MTDRTPANSFLDGFLEGKLTKKRVSSTVVDVPLWIFGIVAIAFFCCRFFATV